VVSISLRIGCPTAGSLARLRGRWPALMVDEVDISCRALGRGIERTDDHRGSRRAIGSEDVAEVAFAFPARPPESTGSRVAVRGCRALQGRRRSVRSVGCRGGRTSSRIGTDSDFVRARAGGGRVKDESIVRPFGPRNGFAVRSAQDERAFRPDRAAWVPCDTSRSCCRRRRAGSYRVLKRRQSEWPQRNSDSGQEKLGRRSGNGHAAAGDVMPPRGVSRSATTLDAVRVWRHSFRHLTIDDPVTCCSARLRRQAGPRRVAGIPGRLGPGGKRLVLRDRTAEYRSGPTDRTIDLVLHATSPARARTNPNRSDARRRATSAHPTGSRPSRRRP